MAQSKQTLLIADNLPGYLRTLKEFFEVEGYAVHTAEDPTEARRVLESEPIDLAILDLRLRENTEETDVSGLEVATEVKPEVPKIILTQYPRWEDVRGALSPTDNGRPPAVDFIFKDEGLEALLRAVRLALLSLPPELEKNLLRAFDVHAPVALRNRLEKIGAEGAAARMGQAFDDTSAEMHAHRERESARATRLHMSGLVASIAGIGLILVAGALLIAGVNTGGGIALVSGVVSKAVGVLFSWREDKAHKRVEFYYRKLEELSRADKILVICKSLESGEARDEYKKKVIDYLLSGK